MYLSQYPLWISAINTLFLGIIISGLLYLLIGWIFQKTGIEKILFKLFGQRTRIGHDSLPRAVGKYIAIFVFLLFLREAVKEAGYTDVEQFMSRLLDYFPHLLLALLITFFGIQMSQTAYRIIFNALRLENKHTATVLGHVARVVILFFTFTIVLDQINAGLEIIPEYLIKSILIGFVAATSLAAGLAFWLGWQKAAHQIIEQFMSENIQEKNLKK